jgi:cobalt-zinc-cadmium efflux system outer membrane protein
MRKLAVCAALCLASTAPAIAQDRVVAERLTLAEALTLAAARNPLYAAARNGVEAAEAQRLDASRRLNPAFTVDSVGRPIGQTPPVIDDHEYLFRIDQEIETGGRRRLRTQVAEAAIDVAKADAANQLRQLELEVRRAYFQAVLAKADREVAEVSLKEIDEVVALNRARLSSGEISGAELRRVQVERLRFVDDVFASELALRNAKSALLTLLNAPNLGEEFDVVEPLAGPTGEGAALVATIVPSSLLEKGLAQQQALASRPDVLAARSGETRAESETRLQRALRTPNVTVGGGYSHIAGLNTFAFGATVPLPLFNRNQGAVLRAEADRKAAANRTAAAVAQASLDVQQAQNAVGINSARVAYIEREYLKNATEARDIVLASYRLGSANLIDFLDAQRSFRDTVRTYNRALFEQRVSIFQLQAAVGAPASTR